MANAMTEHSKKLRAKTAAAHTQKALEEGKVRRILLQMPTDLANEFDEILAELGNSRPQGIKALCEIYRTYKNKTA
ncbi:hypothetical protein [Avibacterium paragallinarum]|uniref:Uncharacterized protein n=1 Tax=Avibacterium paragallinarum TaxID=728 RepID=A0AAE5WHK5_AVIPA|nr:hypothetical protein [Avibacterium paragallinarum]MEE3608244.1 hypothetical protein [Avibacterium paragallinarum]MEE3622336.1 hypothetical protein [Avibacterium paragallinarum]MEE3668393.1 hypothetical protein [Avibacterium paragallinarum]MEE3680403.1 hypothetical protein [Avibacterium paragallinarum]MEE4385938.1 hypothetical protein [Avibacterium paragallinarum]